MVHLVAGMGNVNIDPWHAVIGISAVITVMEMCQIMQYVVCTLSIALKDVPYSDHFASCCSQCYRSYTLPILLPLLCSNN